MLLSEDDWQTISVQDIRSREFLFDGPNNIPPSNGNDRNVKIKTDLRYAIFRYFLGCRLTGSGIF